MTPNDLNESESDGPTCFDMIFLVGKGVWGSDWLNSLLSSDVRGVENNFNPVTVCGMKGDGKTMKQEEITHEETDFILCFLLFDDGVMGVSAVRIFFRSRNPRPPIKEPTKTFGENFGDVTSSSLLFSAVWKIFLLLLFGGFVHEDRVSDCESDVKLPSCLDL